MVLGAMVVTAGPALAEKPQRGAAVTSGERGAVPIVGEYWAVIVGIDRYRHVEKLDSAVRDAQAVREVLVQRYGFAPGRVTMLLNDQATREAIEDALFAVGKRAGPEDSLFIYYAGHGQTDPDTQRGFWVPVDGKAQSPGTLISNARIRDEIAAMKAKHIYLVADSCFAGTLFGQSRALPPLNEKVIARLYQDKSRWGLTSGANEPVADTGKGGHSVFAYFFLKLLRENEDPYLVPSRISEHLTTLVVNNSAQRPRSQPLQGAGDEGGQFVFRLASTTGGPLPSPAPPPASSGVSLDEFLAMKKRLEEIQRKEAQQKQAGTPPKAVEEIRPKPVEPRAKDVKPSVVPPEDVPQAIVEARLHGQESSPPVSLSAPQAGKFNPGNAQWQRFSLDDLEREWRRVKQYAERADTNPGWRLAALQQFKRTFPRNNPYLDEAESLIRVVEREKDAVGTHAPQMPESMRETSGVLAMRPVENLQTACNDGQAAACQELGWRYEVGGDDGQAAAAYRRGCTDREPLVCLSLGRLANNGRAPSDDFRRAADMLARACDGGDGSACTMAKNLEEERRKLK